MSLFELLGVRAGSEFGFFILYNPLGSIWCFRD